MCRGVSHTPFMAGKRHVIQTSCHPWNNRKCVGAYRIRPSWRENCIFDDNVMLGVIGWNHPVQSSCHPCNNRTCVGAYRIRPPWRGCCIFDGGILFVVIISFSLTSGRMRYAPTPVRWKLNAYRIKILRQMIFVNLISINEFMPLYVFLSWFDDEIRIECIWWYGTLSLYLPWNISD